MVYRLLIDAALPAEVRVATVKDSRLEEFDFESSAKKQIKGNIYLAKVTRVEPSLQAAFVEYGGNRQGFLPFSEIHPDFFQIPVEDKEAFLEEASDYNAEDKEEEVAKKTKASSKKGKASDAEAEEAEEAEIEEGKDSISGEIESAEETPEEDDIEEVAEEVSFRRSDFYKRYHIQEVVRRNQILLVQVIKEERGNKGASLTTYVSLAGRYCVFMPNTPGQGGVSRRISDDTKRKRLKAILPELNVPKESSVIIRTAGTDRRKTEIKRDYEYLTNLWNDIRGEVVKTEAPSLTHEEGNLVIRALRDIYNSDVDDILIEGEEAFTMAKEFMKQVSPSHVAKVKQYKESVPLFTQYKIEQEMAKLHDNTAELKSGGSIVINPTEALVAIDVNSGKSTRTRSVEDTATKTNLEAAHEVARQLRLRDLAGLVVIDFIDMFELKNKKAVERALKEALKNDRAKIQVGRISSFGLLEMSRQRLRSSLVEASTSTCPICKGLGVVRSPESVAFTMLRAIEAEAQKGRFGDVVLKTASEAGLYLLNQKREEIQSIEDHASVKVRIEIDHSLVGSDFHIERSKGGRGGSRRDNQRENRKRNNNRKRKEPVNAPEQKQEVEAGNSAVANDDHHESHYKKRHHKRSNYQADGDRMDSPRRSKPPHKSRSHRSHKKGPKGDVNGNMMVEDPALQDAPTAKVPEVENDQEKKNALKGLWKKITN